MAGTQMTIEALAQPIPADTTNVQAGARLKSTTTIRSPLATVLT